MPQNRKKEERGLEVEALGPQESRGRRGVRIRDEVLDELLGDYRGPEDLLGPGGLLKELTGALINQHGGRV